MQRMSILAQYNGYEIGKDMSGCIYLLHGNDLNSTFDSAFMAVHSVQDPVARWKLAEQLTPCQQEAFGDDL